MIIEIISSEKNRMKLNIINRRRIRKFTDMWKFNNTVLNNQSQRRNQKGKQKIP